MEKPTQRQYFMRLWHHPPRCSYHFKSDPLYNTASPVGRTHGSKNQGVEAKEALLPITPSDPLRESVLSIP